MGAVGNVTKESLERGYDLVGKYTQDRINGFSEDFITQLVEIADVARTELVIDAMAGDGNLSVSILDYLNKRELVAPKKMIVLEFSRVQSEFARMRFAENPDIEVLWSDLLSLTNRADGSPVELGKADRVIIKSGTHEISSENQHMLYESVFRLLKPGGLFINLGFLFEDIAEREEFLHITHVKDGLAGLDLLVQNRFFSVRSEFYGKLKDVGFSEVRQAKAIEYTIESRTAAEQYFSEAQRDDYHYQLQAVQAGARTLRRNGRISFAEDYTIMRVPGEITVARKPTIDERANSPYENYQYDGVRHVQVHRELMDRAAAAIAPQSSVLDLGCGVGLLGERLFDTCSRYEGVDNNKQFIEICRQRHGTRKNVTFDERDIVSLTPHGGRWDYVTLLNVLYHQTIDPIRSLQLAFQSLRSGGSVLVSGPSSKAGFSSIEDLMLEQLTRDRVLEKFPTLFETIQAANHRLISEHGNYWSAEGMCELLLRIGWRTIRECHNDIFYGAGYYVIAEK